MVKRFAASILAGAAIVTTLASAATMEDEVHAVFDKYIAVQNAHDLKAMRNLLIDSPDFLWVTRGKPIWGREAALKGLEERYKGTWHIEPDRKEFRVISYINLVMVKKPEGWRIASILPILVPPQ